MTQRWWNRPRNPDLEEEEETRSRNRVDAKAAELWSRLHGILFVAAMAAILYLRFYHSMRSRASKVETRLRSLSRSPSSPSPFVSLSLSRSLSLLLSDLRRPSSRIHGLPSFLPSFLPSVPPLLTPSPTPPPFASCLPAQRPARREPSPLPSPSLSLSLSLLSPYFSFSSRSPPLWRTSRTSSILVAPAGVARTASCKRSSNRGPLFPLSDQMPRC